MSFAFINRKKMLFFITLILCVMFLPENVIAAETTSTINPKLNHTVSIETTTSWNGHNIPVNPVTKQVGVGKACIEMHLATDKYNPWQSYLELKNLPTKYKTDNYMSAPGGGLISRQTWEMNNYQPTTFPGGALGYMTPSQEIWYMNMRWEYVTWYVDGNGSTRTKDVDWDSLKWHREHRKVLVTNLKTGLQAIAYIGDSGPALNLGSPPGSRIAGLSPDLMYYLSNQEKDIKYPVTTLGADNETDYSFAWVVDQSLPLGPIQSDNIINPLGDITSAITQPSINPKPTANVKKSPEVPDFGKGYVRILRNKTSIITDWQQGTPPFLHKNSVFPVVSQSEGWYQIYVDKNTKGWVAEDYVFWQETYRK